MGEINTTFFNNLDNATTWSAGVAFKRSKALPLDKYSVFKNKELAIEYAEKTGTYAETPVSYPGQIIAVSENGKMIAYVLTENLESNKLELQQIGVIPAGDNTSIKVDENGIISLSGLDTIQEIEDEDGNPITYQPRYKNGKLTWEKLSSTTIEDVGAQLKGLEEDIIDLGKLIPTDEEITEIVDAAAAKFNKAAFEKVEFLPDPLFADPNVLYLLPVDDKFEIYAKIGDEMILIDDTDVSLEGYATTEDIKDFVKKDVLNNYLLSSVLDTLVSKDGFEEVLNASATIEALIEAANKSHSHENKTILDSITQDLIDKWNLGEANVIGSVDSEEFTLQDKALAIKLISAEKISGCHAAYGSRIG